MKEFELYNGVKIPAIGYGTWKIPNNEESEELVAEAIRVGYRHIDTAEGYENEDMVGRAIKKSGVPREELFITSKLANSCETYEDTIKAFEETLEKLQTDYLDLFLIHWPAPLACRDRFAERNLSIWRAFEELYASGRLKAMGVSNFFNHHLDALLPYINVKPMVHQIEVHPFNFDKENIEYSRKNGMLIEGFSPLARGQVFGNQLLADMAQKYGKNVSQICIRWCLQKDVLPLPKTTKTYRLKENLEVFDFTISPEDMAVIDSLIKPDGRIISNPDTAKY